MMRKENTIRKNRDPTRPGKRILLRRLFVGGWFLLAGKSGAYAQETLLVPSIINSGGGLRQNDSIQLLSSVAEPLASGIKSAPSGEPNLGSGFLETLSVQAPVLATVNIDPDTLNVGSEGRFVSAFIELPQPLDVSLLIATSVAITKMDDTSLSQPLLALSSPTETGDFNSNGIPEKIVKFDRKALENLLLPFLKTPTGTQEKVFSMTIEGRLTSGPPFTTEDTIRVIQPPLTAPGIARKPEPPLGLSRRSASPSSGFGSPSSSSKPKAHGFVSFSDVASETEQVVLEIPGKKLSFGYKKASVAGASRTSPASLGRGAAGGFSSMPPSLAKPQKPGQSLRRNPGGRIEVSEGEGLLYEEIEEGIDLSYEAMGNKVKETLIFKKHPGRSTFEFPISFQGVIPQMRPDGTLYFRDATSGQEMFYFEKPFLVDARGTRLDATMKLTSDHTRLTITFDPNWLAPGQRAYPVALDPTLVLISTNVSVESLIPEWRVPEFYISPNGSFHVIGGFPLTGEPILYRRFYHFSTNGDIWQDVVIATADFFPVASAVSSSDIFHAVFNYKSDLAIEIPSPPIYYRNGVAGSMGSSAMLPINGLPCALATDGSDNLHMVYLVPEDPGLFGTWKYSKRTGGEWSTPVSIPTGKATHHLSMFIDSSGVIHFLGLQTSGLVYFTLNGGTFSTPEVVFQKSSQRAGGYPFAGTITTASVYAAYLEFPNPQSGDGPYKLQVRRKDRQTGAWQSEVLISTRLVLNSSPIDLIADDAGNAHLYWVIENGTTTAIAHSDNADGVWETHIMLTSSTFSTPISGVGGPAFALGRKNQKVYLVFVNVPDNTHPSRGVWISSHSFPPNFPPGPAKNLAAANLEENRIRLSWTPSVTKDTRWYRVHYSSNPSGIDFSVIRATLTHPAASWTSPILQEDTLYRFSVVAVDDTFLVDGSSPTVTATATNPPPGPARNLSAVAVSSSQVRLSWISSVALGLDLAGYRVYFSTTGVVNYSVILATLSAAATSWTSPASLGLQEGLTYRFSIVAFDTLGKVDGSSPTVSVIPLSNTTPASGVRASIKAPQSGRKVSGNRLTVVAEITQGAPSDVKQVLFQWKPSSQTIWQNITPAVSEHPNPDLSSPYFIHWDVSSMAAGSYDIRAVAFNLSSSSDTFAPAVSVLVDHAQPEIAETSSGSQITKLQRIENDIGAEVVVGGGNNGSSGSSAGLARVVFPAGALSNLTDKVQVVMNPSSPPDPPKLRDPPRKLLSSGVGQNVSLETGQTSFSSAVTLEIPYPDANQDGIVDGTSISEGSLEVWSETSGNWSKHEVLSRDTKKNTITSQTTHFSFFGLFASKNLPAEDLSEAYAYPVPYLPGDARYGAAHITFAKLPKEVSFEIFDVSGHRIASFSKNDESPTYLWDVKDAAGQPASSGVYLAYLKSGSSSKVIKLVVVR